MPGAGPELFLTYARGSGPALRFIGIAPSSSVRPAVMENERMTRRLLIFAALIRYASRPEDVSGGCRRNFTE